MLWKLFFCFDTFVFCLAGLSALVVAFHECPSPSCFLIIWQCLGFSELYFCFSLFISALPFPSCFLAFWQCSSFSELNFYFSVFMSAFWLSELYPHSSKFHTVWFASGQPIENSQINVCRKSKHSPCQLPKAAFLSISGFDFLFFLQTTRICAVFGIVPPDTWSTL